MTVVHGAAEGADTLAGQVAHGYGWTVERHPVDWKQHRRAGGPRRNAEMVAAGADLCLVFATRWDSDAG